LYDCFPSLADAGGVGATASHAAAVPATHVYAGKTLEERITGRFYTPGIVADDLARRMLDTFERRSSIPDTISISDPFCGDGRLIAAVIMESARRSRFENVKWFVHLADVDGQALHVARTLVRDLATSLDLAVTFRIECGDSFLDYTGHDVDLIITNPPWELLKPDTREVVSLTPLAADAYRLRLRQMSDRLDQKYPEARGDGAWGGWGTNLARCGWYLSLDSLSREGILGIILPATIMGDQSSLPMRRSVFGRADLIDLAAFPSEARLFDRVDQPVVAATFANGKDARRETATLRPHLADGTLGDTHPLDMSEGALARRDFAIPVGFGLGCDAILSTLAQHSFVRSLEGAGSRDLWLGRELDETRIIEKVRTGSAFPFVKGRMIARHGVVETPDRSVHRHLAVGLHSIAHERVVWRDVARASQERRMIGTIIPKGWVAGNSLHVACYRDGDPVRTRSLHGLLSSFAFEFQVRARSTTGHMSLGIIRAAAIPELTSVGHTRLAKLVDRVLNGERGALDMLEVRVAKLFGLDRNAFSTLLDQFVKTPSDRKDALLSPKLW